MATFPSTLPAPLQQSYGLEPLKQSIRTPMEVGFPRMRRISKARYDSVTVQWIFNSAQMATFRTWYENDSEAAGGVSFFDMLIDIGTGSSVVRQCRFADDWTFTREGKFYRVNAKLEVRV